MDNREFQIKLAQARLKKAAERHALSTKLASCCKAKSRKLKKRAEAKEAVLGITKKAFLPFLIPALAGAATGSAAAAGIYGAKRAKKNRMIEDAGKMYEPTGSRDAYWHEADRRKEILDPEVQKYIQEMDSGRPGSWLWRRFASPKSIEKEERRLIDAATRKAQMDEAERAAAKLTTPRLMKSDELVDRYNEIMKQRMEEAMKKVPKKPSGKSEPPVPPPEAAPEAPAAPVAPEAPPAAVPPAPEAAPVAPPAAPVPAPAPAAPVAPPAAPVPAPAPAAPVAAVPPPAPAAPVKAASDLTRYEIGVLKKLAEYGIDGTSLVKTASKAQFADLSTKALSRIAQTSGKTGRAFGSKVKSNGDVGEIIRAVGKFGDKVDDFAQRSSPLALDTRGAGKSWFFRSARKGNASLQHAPKERLAAVLKEQEEAKRRALVRLLEEANA